MALPKFLQPCFPSYNLKSLDKNRDKKLIITQILNFGTEKDLTWLGKNYSQSNIKKIVSSPTRGMWLKSVLDYWLKQFRLKISKLTYNLAIINLDPQPKLIERFFNEQERKNKNYHQRLKELGLNSF